MFIVTSNNEYINFNKSKDSLYIKIEEQKVSIILMRQTGIHINIFSTLEGDIKENIDVCKTTIEDIILNDELFYNIDTQFYQYKEKFSKIKGKKTEC